MKEIDNLAGYLYGKCMECNKRFNKTRLPNMPKCNHLVCDRCFKMQWSREKKMFICVICQISLDALEVLMANTEMRARFKKITNFCEDVKQLQVEKEQNKNKEISSLKEVIELKEKSIIMMKKEIEAFALSHIGDVKCSECGKHENERSVQVCISCFTQKLESIVTFDSIAICPLCAIRSHLKRGHEVTDFYPILRQFQFDNHCENLKPKLESNQQENGKLKQEMDKVMVVIGEGEKELNKMTEMMGRCKTSARQECLATKITQQIDSNSGHVKKFREVVANFGRKMKAANNKLKEENNAENVENCDEEELAGVN